MCNFKKFSGVHALRLLSNSILLMLAILSTAFWFSWPAMLCSYTCYHHTCTQALIWGSSPVCHVHFWNNTWSIKIVCCLFSHCSYSEIVTNYVPIQWMCRLINFLLFRVGPLSAVLLIFTVTDVFLCHNRVPVLCICGHQYLLSFFVVFCVYGYGEIIILYSNRATT